MARLSLRHSQSCLCRCPEKYTLPTVKHGGGSITLWDCIAASATGHIFNGAPVRMGVKVLLCFPFYRRSKEQCKNKECPPDTDPAVQTEKPKLRLSSTTSVVSEGDSSSSLGSPQVYFSQKARLSFRHQMDSNFNAIDATY